MLFCCNGSCSEISGIRLINRYVINRYVSYKFVALVCLIFVVFTALRCMQHGLSDRQAVCPSVSLSVSHTREL